MKGQNTFRGPWPAFRTSEGEAVVVGDGGSEAVLFAGDTLNDHLAKLKAEAESCPFAGKVGDLATVRFGDVEQDVVFRGAYPLHDGRGGVRGWSFDFQTSGAHRPVVGEMTEAELETLAANVLNVEPAPFTVNDDGTLTETATGRLVTPACENLRVSETGAARSNDTADVRYDLITPIGLRAVAKVYGEIGYEPTDAHSWLREALDDAYSFLAGEGDTFLAAAALDVLEAIQALSAKDDPSRLASTGGHDLGGLPRYDLVAPDGLAEVARRYAIGAKKYRDFNWERGLDANDIINHGIRHIRNYLAGDLDDEDALLNHLGAAAWNFMAAIHSLRLWPSLNAGKFRRRGCRLPEGLLTPEQEAKLYGDAA